MNHMRTLVTTLATILLTTASLLQASEPIRISVPASMTDAVKELAARFEASAGPIGIVINSGASGALAKQIAEGAPADLFISANAKWMNYLHDEKMIDPDSEQVFATNTLVFAGLLNPAITGMAAVTELERIAIASPKSAPAGEYAMQALEGAGLARALEAEGKLVLAKDVRHALAYADRGETDGAFVYRTDALRASRAVILFEVPAALYGAVTYPVALTKGGATKPAARQLHAFLTGAGARQILRQHGFGTPD
ncbi:MAG: molybdate ABC transporter substrate-binding protein [Desulfobulbus sp.]|jgi:molybdate transport system substrate-binding protein|nr:molybdate ABC transporter substrate-binding protein [Desulfobulbus sp.]